MKIPIGAANSDLQSAANASLASIDGKITAINTNSVTVTSTVLPTGASTSALQATGNDLVSAISTKLTPSSATLTSVNAISSTAPLLASNASRRGFILYNHSGNDAFVAFASAATTSAFSFVMKASSHYEALHPVYTGALAAIWTSASGAMKITEVST